MPDDRDWVTRHAYEEMKGRAIAAETALAAIRNDMRLEGMRRWGRNYRWRLAAMFPRTTVLLEAADQRVRERRWPRQNHDHVHAAVRAVDALEP